MTTVAAVAVMDLPELRDHVKGHGLRHIPRGWNRVDLVAYHDRRHRVGVDHDHQRVELPPMDEEE